MWCPQEWCKDTECVSADGNVRKSERNRDTVSRKGMREVSSLHWNSITLGRVLPAATPFSISHFIKHIFRRRRACREQDRASQRWSRWQAEILENLSAYQVKSRDIFWTGKFSLNETKRHNRRQAQTEGGGRIQTWIYILCLTLHTFSCKHHTTVKQIWFRFGWCSYQDHLLCASGCLSLSL